MPRISPRIIREAYSYSKLLPPLLRAAPLEQAKRELKWIQQELPQKDWFNAIVRRSRLVPLQYILRSQPFGPLDIICRPGVLIPRWETEEWCFKLSRLISANETEIGILDACTGTGCIPLLLDHELSVETKIIGFDISQEAYQLSKDNLEKYILKFSSSSVTFLKEDIFNYSPGNFDLITSNPPYIPLLDYKSSVKNNGVEKSVRIYEPELALVGENEFYKALVDLVLASNARGFVFELGYESQLEFVSERLRDSEWTVERMDDSSGNIRCAIGWKSGMEYLKGMTEFV